MSAINKKGEGYSGRFFISAAHASESSAELHLHKENSITIPNLQNKDLSLGDPREEGLNGRSSLGPEDLHPIKEHTHKGEMSVTRNYGKTQPAGNLVMTGNPQEIPMHGALYHPSNDPPSLGRVHSTPHPHISKLQPRSETPVTSELEDTKCVPMQLVTSLQQTLCSKFTEMMDLHKDVMLQMVARDAKRDEQMSSLIQENLELVRTVTKLQLEQARLREKLYGKE